MVDAVMTWLVAIPLLILGVVFVVLWLVIIVGALVMAWIAFRDVMVLMLTTGDVNDNLCSGSTNGTDVRVSDGCDDSNNNGKHINKEEVDE